MKEHFWRSRGTQALWMAIAILILVELTLQTRAHLRFGRSAFNGIFAESTFVYNPGADLRLYRANAVIEGTSARIETNSMGLRSPEIEPELKPDEIRIAVVGASTVAGAYAKRNADTFSYILTEKLQKSFSGRSFTVINAGIPGNTMAEHYRMIKNVVLPLDPSLVILYPGNNFNGYCGESEAFNSESDKNYALPVLELPSWVLSIDLITKNTVSIRDVPAGRAGTVQASKISTNEYEGDVQQIIDLVYSNYVPLIITDNARSFRREMPHDMQMHLSETIRFIYPCFDLETLHHVADEHNATLRTVAERNGVPFLALSRQVLGGPEYFSDATHFSRKGEEVVAERLFDFIVRHDLIDKVSATGG